MHVGVGAGQDGGVDRGQREAEAEAARSPGRCWTTGRAGVSTSQRDISAKPTADMRHADRGDQPGAAGADQVAADDRADRQRDQEPDQHQRRHQLASRGRSVVRAKIGMSISAAISAAPTKKLTSTAPQAGVRRSAPRGSSGASARRRWSDEGDGRDRGAEEVPEPLVGEDLDRRVGGGEGQDHAAERERRAAARRRRSASRALRPQPRRSTSGRFAVAQRTTNSTSGDHRDHADRGQPAAVAGERDEELAPGQVADQARRPDEDDGPGDQGDQQEARSNEVPAWPAVVRW